MVLHDFSPFIFCGVQGDWFLVQGKASSVLTFFLVAPNPQKEPIIVLFLITEGHGKCRQVCCSDVVDV